MLPLAHETWFQSGHRDLDWSFAGETLTLVLLAGALPQAVVLIAGVPFNASLWFFGVNELLGHLPVYGAMLVLLVYGSDRELRARAPDLWPWRARR
jgi:hypothetical protein